MFDISTQKIAQCLRHTPEYQRLALLHKHGNWQDAHEATQRRLYMHRRISACAENGKIAIIESGRDCDGVKYSGLVTIIDAHWRAYLRHEEYCEAWADGPFTLTIERPSVKIEYESRDLTLEAFENGHPHSLHA